MQLQRTKFKGGDSCLEIPSSKARSIHFLIHVVLLSFYKIFYRKNPTECQQSPVKFISVCGHQILDPTQKLFSLVDRQNTSCLSDELVYPRASYLANRQMAKKVKLVAALLVIRAAGGQLKQPEANRVRGQSPSPRLSSQNPAGTQLAGKELCWASFTALSPQPSENRDSPKILPIPVI